MSVIGPVISLPDELHSFIQLLLAKPELRAHLGDLIEVEAFVTAAAVVAKQHDVPLDLELLREILRPDPLGVGRFNAAPIELNHWPPREWLPVWSIPTDGAPAFDWMWFGDRSLTQPFFTNESRTAGALPLNALLRVRTGFDVMVAGAEREPGLPLKGLIFHMSRCGSTLLAQMLAAVPANTVFSEPEPLDGVIQWARLNNIETASAIPAIRAVVAALGRDRQNGAKALIIKTDPWQAFSMPLLCTAFPEANWIYLYRSGTEVMVSTMEQPGVHTVEGYLPEAIIGFSPEPGSSNEDFAARVLAGLGKAALAQWDCGGGMIVAYPEIRNTVCNRIADHFDLVLNPDDVAAMMAISEYDSKDPATEFVNDTLRKQKATTPAIAAAVGKWLHAVEGQLDSLSDAERKVSIATD